MLTGFSNKSLLNVAVVCIAISLPAIILGRTVVAVPLVIAILLLVFSQERNFILHQTISAIRSPLAGAIAAVAVIWTFGLLASSDPGRSATTEARTILYIALTVPFWALVSRNNDTVDLCLKALVTASFLLGGIAVIALYSAPSFIGTLRGNPDTPLAAARILKESAASSSLIIPLLILAVWRQTGKWRLIGYLAIALMIAMVLLTQNRSALAGLVGGAFAVALVFNLYRRDALGLTISCLVCVVAVGLAIYWLYTARIGYVGQYGNGGWLLPEWLIDPPRQAIWKFAWEVGEPHRWFGSGINVMDKLPGADNWNLDTGTRNIPLHPHNWMVEIAIETGVVGLLGLLGVIALFTWTKIKCYVRSGSPALLSLAGVWGAYWVSGLFNFSYWSSWWQISFLVATAICLAGDEARHQKVGGN